MNQDSSVSFGRSIRNSFRLSFKPSSSSSSSSPVKTSVSHANLRNVPTTTTNKRHSYHDTPISAPVPIPTHPNDSFNEIFHKSRSSTVVPGDRYYQHSSSSLPAHGHGVAPPPLKTPGVKHYAHPPPGAPTSSSWSANSKNSRSINSLSPPSTSTYTPSVQHHFNNHQQQPQSRMASHGDQQQHVPRAQPSLMNLPPMRDVWLDDEDDQDDSRNKNATNLNSNNTPKNNKPPAKRNSLGGVFQLKRFGSSKKVPPSTRDSKIVHEPSTQSLSTTTTNTTIASSNTNSTLQNQQQHRYSQSKLSLASLRSNSTAPPPSSHLQNRSSRRIFSFVAGKHDQVQISKLNISAPTNFVHQRHIDVDHLRAQSEQELLRTLSLRGVQGSPAVNSLSAQLHNNNNQLKHSNNNTSKPLRPQRPSSKETTASTASSASESTVTSAHTASTTGTSVLSSSPSPSPRPLSTSNHRHEESMSSVFSSSTTTTTTTRPVSLMSSSAAGTPLTSGNSSPALDEKINNSESPPVVHHGGWNNEGVERTPLSPMPEMTEPVVKVSTRNYSYKPPRPTTTPKLEAPVIAPYAGPLPSVAQNRAVRNANTISIYFAQEHDKRASTSSTTLQGRSSQLLSSQQRRSSSAASVRDERIKLPLASTSRGAQASMSSMRMTSGQVLSQERAKFNNSRYEGLRRVDEQVEFEWF